MHGPCVVAEIRRQVRLTRLLLMVTSFLFCHACQQASGPEPIRVAVAANFAETLRELALRYEAETGQGLRISVGSTGALFSQIEQGAPFDCFFAADVRRPRLLEQAALALPGSRQTYARGALVLWSADPQLVDGLQVLRSENAFQRLAIANPTTAPYGLAARQTLEALGLWEPLQERLVMGQSIGQTFQFVQSGAAELGLVAMAQLHGSADGSRHPVPPDLHAPIEQQMVLLREDPAVWAFWTWILNDAGARDVIHDFGYATVPTL
ncbi:MAG: molybdate ABC transporter substrate-binding protein [Planctomycetota bacterium]